MEPEQVVPTTTTDQQPPQQERHSFAHTYQEDLAQAMDATDATSVQKMLEDARAQDAESEQVHKEHSERGWYSASSIFLLMLALGILAYGAYYYVHLTVPITPVSSVGVFQSSDNILASSVTPETIVAKYATDTTLVPGKPLLINLVNDKNVLLTNSELYSFIGATVPEPLQSVITIARLGVVQTDKGVVPFIIASTSDPEKTSREFTIAEPTLLEMFSRIFSIDTTKYEGVPTSFQSQYFYNIPVRTFSTVVDPTTGTKDIAFLYGYISNNVVVITTKPEALKALYDTIIDQ